MSHPHDDTDPIEHDPTGMRALLGSLPDPGPMPADLVARIEAALAAEAAAAADTDLDQALLAAAAPVRVDADAQRPGAGALRPSEDPDDDLDDRVVPLRRRRRSSWHLVAVAAGVVGVLGIGGLVVETLRPGGLQASIGMAEDSASGADSAGGAAAPEAAGGGARTLFAEDGSLGVVVLGSGRRYTAAGLATEVRASLPWDGTGREPTTAPSGSESKGARPDRETAYGPLSSADGARACAEGLGVPVADTVVVDLADVDGRAAAVLVATTAEGKRRVWAVSRSCTADAPGVLTGPVAVP
ncbi:hypothetical protein G7075_16770 [Phycicoccus sp. HDW14]|uniref:hypothetical protein n=1 Tax=Phycicoccus sp. HDW14 TaxID=2714941 RepID=UPI001409590A|nr:hypothetical protein [Phycicoccus sp. HDW14]QIM22401.1 hypothetical protein G7075_16770 [Phycicoccus sp. HDW14]